MAAFVAVTKIQNNAGSSASASVSATASNALIADVSGFYSGAVQSPALTVSGGGTWANSGSDGTDNQHFTSTNDNFVVGFAHCPNATGGSNTVTVTFATPSVAGITSFINEFSGMATSSMLDAVGTGAQGSASPVTTNAQTNSNANDVFVAMGETYSSSLETHGSPGNGWTMPSGGDETASSQLTAVTAYKIVSSSASNSTSWTDSPSTKWASFIACYKSTASAQTLSPVGVFSLETIGVQAVRLVQDLSPIADINAGGWTTNTGSTTNLFAALDELVPDNADYIQSAAQSTTDAVTISLGPGITPGAGPRTLTYRYGKDQPGGRQVDLTVELLQGGTVVQTWTHTDVPSGFVEVAQDVTATITDYTALSVRLTKAQV